MMLALNQVILLLIVIFALGIAVSGNNDSSVYFPIDSDDAMPENSHSYASGKNTVQQILEPKDVDLVALRGTSVYEKYVEDIIAKGITKLTLAINKLLMTHTKTQENVVFSPVSISSALALVFLGSNGITFKQISEIWGLELGIPDIDQKSQIVHEQFSRMLRKLNETSGFQLGQEINHGSAIFVQQGYPIRPIYRSTAEDLYRSSILNVDFASHPEETKNLINNWVAEKTNNKIKYILSETLSSDTKVILASALYFKAEWEQHFFEGLTTRRPFFINGRAAKSNIQVEMMSNGGEFPYHKDSELGCEILGLPYKGSKSTMYVIMPFQSSSEKLRAFESKVTEAELDKLVKKTKMTGVILTFPKMKLETTIDLEETLKLLGVTSLFDPAQANLALLSPGDITTRSQFQNESVNNIDKHQPISSQPAVPQTESRIGGASKTIDNIRQLINQQSTDNHFQNPGLYADKVIHKVFMDINEMGTEAAAATSVTLSKDGSRVIFRVDVPFCFFIRHEETNTILFWGSVVIPNPSFTTF